MKIKTLSLLMSVALLCTFSLMDMSCSSNEDPAPDECANSTLSVTVPPGNITNTTSCANNDGQITAVGAGGTAPYQYKIGSGAYQASATFANLAAGSYIITIKDSKGCEKPSDNVVVDNTASDLLASVKPEDIVVDTDCLAGNGEFTVTVTGGTGPFQYKLGAGAFGNSATFTNLEGGVYSVTVKDAENCTSTKDVTVGKGATGITYDADIKPILQAKCNFNVCHPANGDWFTYATASASAGSIKTRTGNGTMPKAPQPGGALTANEIKMIACWADDGAPQ